MYTVLLLDDHEGTGRRREDPQGRKKADGQDQLLRVDDRQRPRQVRRVGDDDRSLARE